MHCNENLSHKIYIHTCISYFLFDNLDYNHCNYQWTILLSDLDRWRCWYIGSWFSLTTQLYCIGSYHLSPLSLVNFSQRELFRSVSLQPSVLLHLVTMSSVESQQVSGTGDVGRGLISTRKCLDSAQSPGYQESQLEPRGKISVKSSCILTNNMIIL